MVAAHTSRCALPALAAGSFWLHRKNLAFAENRDSSKQVPDDWKETFPREWAIWHRIDRNHQGVITNGEVRKMCNIMDCTRHADFLVRTLDPRGTGFTTFPSFVKRFDAVACVRNAARHRAWHRTYGLGVAGNVAGHMEQAGEAEAPKKQDGPAKKPKTPAAVFTFFAPHPHEVDATEEEVQTGLAQFPVTNAVINFPHLEGAKNVQVEPEMGLYVDIVYAKDEKSVERIIPRRVAAFNDCSIRSLDGSSKLSEKKNWGEGSKGISLKSFRVKSLSPGTLVDHLVLLSYIKRDGQTFQYSVQAPARNYLMFHEPLLEWIVDRINNQRSEDKWEEIFSELVKCDYPTSMWIALGAGEYTPWGATNYLRPGDESLVMIYNEDVYPEGPSSAVVEALFEDDIDDPVGVIALHQTFI